MSEVECEEMEAKRGGERNPSCDWLGVRICCEGNGEPREGFELKSELIKMPFKCQKKKKLWKEKCRRPDHNDDVGG